MKRPLKFSMSKTFLLSRCHRVWQWIQTLGGTFIITSGAYAGPDFVSTFGLLPPAFLPVGNQRLYELQAELIEKNDSRKIISVPDDFMIEDHERARLMALGFDIIPVSTGISLGASIAQVLERGR